MIWMTINLTRKTKISPIPKVCCLFRLERTLNGDSWLEMRLLIGGAKDPSSPACQFAKLSAFHTRLTSNANYWLFELNWKMTGIDFVC